MLALSRTFGNSSPQKKVGRTNNDQRYSNVGDQCYVDKTILAGLGDDELSGYRRESDTDCPY